MFDLRLCLSGGLCLSLFCGQFFDTLFSDISVQTRARGHVLDTGSWESAQRRLCKFFFDAFATASRRSLVALFLTHLHSQVSGGVFSLTIIFLCVYTFARRRTLERLMGGVMAVFTAPSLVYTIRCVSPDSDSFANVVLFSFFLSQNLFARFTSFVNANIRACDSQISAMTGGWIDAVSATLLGVNITAVVCMCEYLSSFSVCKRYLTIFSMFI